MGYFYSPTTKGFYHSDLHADMPDDAMPITDAEHEALLSAQDAGAAIGNGEGGLPVASVPVPDLGTLKTNLTTRIDADAEAARLQFVTAGAGQAMTYQAKAAEATACLADASPSPASYPLLAAEVGITAETLSEVAGVVNAAYQQWLTIGAAIEAARLGGKKAVTDASDPAAVQAAFDAVTFPSA